MFKAFLQKLEKLNVKDPAGVLAAAQGKIENIQQAQGRKFTYCEKVALLNSLCYTAYTGRKQDLITIPGAVIRLALPSRFDAGYMLTLTQPLKLNIAKIDTAYSVDFNEWGTINILQTDHGLKAKYIPLPGYFRPMFSASDIYPGDKLYIGDVNYQPILPAGTLIYAIG